MPDASGTRGLAHKAKVRELVTTGTPEHFRHSLRDGVTAYSVLSQEYRA
jgi:hypothetical protein